VGQSHFAGRVEFLDLFLRTEFSSASRGQAFLWLCFNYLESPSSEDDYDEEPAPNPFSDPSKPTSPPSLELLSPEAILAENQESEDDAETLRKLSSQRMGIVETLSTKGTGKAHAKDKASVNGSVMGEDEEMAPPPAEEPKAKGKRAVPTISLKGKGKRGPAPKEKKPVVAVEEKPREKEETGTLVEGDDDDEMLDAFLKRTCPL
jgi:Ino eighty subunit 1